MTAKWKYVKLKRFSKLKDISMVRSLALMLIFLLQVLPAHAGSVQSILEMQAKYASFYKGIKFPSPKKLFRSESDLNNFYWMIRQGDCSSALFKIADEFHKQNSNLPNPMSEGLIAWSDIIAPRDYPELVFCKTMQSLDRYGREIKDKKVSGTIRFSQFEKPRNPNISPSSSPSRRAFVVGDLFRLAMFNYAPAQVALAALSAKGEAVRLTPAYAYFLLSRAKRLGYTASDLAPLLEKAIAALSADERQQLTARIKSGDWPREERRVVD